MTNRKRAEEIIAMIRRDVVDPNTPIWGYHTDRIEQTLDAVRSAVREATIRECEEIAVRRFPCTDPGHDERWCVSCNARDAQGDYVATEILKLLNQNAGE